MGLKTTAFPYPVATSYASLLALAVLLLLGASVQAQSIEELEKKKQENLNQIQEAEQILADTRNQKKATLGQLSALNQQISVSQELINTLKVELNQLNGEIASLDDLISALERDLAKLKEEYGRMIYSAYKAEQNINRLTFLFASESFNQFWQRLSYLRQYSEARERQVEQITKVQQSLARQKINIRNKQSRQEELLAEQMDQSRQLNKLKVQQSEVVGELTAREGELRNELAQRQRSLERLDKLIADLIRAQEEAEAAGDLPSAPEVAALSAGFQNNQGKLPWPVSSGFISGRFGRQPHPVLKGIEINNEGIDIQTNKGESVRTIFDGTVSRVAFVPGMNSVVIIKHGDYYTLYAKMRDVKVKAGDRVSRGDLIGTVYTDGNGVTELQFQIWKQFDKLNPEKWILSR